MKVFIQYSNTENDVYLMDVDDFAEFDCVADNWEQIAEENKPNENAEFIAMYVDES